MQNRLESEEKERENAGLTEILKRLTFTLLKRGNYVDPFQMGFGIERALDVLMEGQGQEREGGREEVCGPANFPGLLSSFQYHWPW